MTRGAAAAAVVVAKRATVRIEIASFILIRIYRNCSKKDLLREIKHVFIL